MTEQAGAPRDAQSGPLRGTVVIVRGLPGVGKTATSALLRDRLAPAVRVSVDTIRYLASPRRIDKATITQGESASVALARSYALQGVNAVLDGVWLDPDALRAMVEEMTSAGLSVEVMNLVASLPELLARNSARETYDRTDEERIRQLFERFTTPVGRVIRTEERVAEEVADDIVKILADMARNRPAEMSERLYFMRHGIAAVDPDHYPRHDVMGLSVLGRAQAAAARNSLASLGIEHIVASPFPRTVETAEIINAVLEVPFSVDERLRERTFPPFYGRSYADIATEIGEEAATLLPYNSAAVAVGGLESIVEAAARTRAAVDDLLRGPYRRTLVVGHGGPHGWLCAHALELPDDQYGRRFPLGHARFSAFTTTADGSRPKLLTLNTDAVGLLGVPQL